MTKLGLVGFGEAAYYLTSEIIPGSAVLYSFDTVASQDSPRGKQLRQRAEENQVTLVSSIEELFAVCNVIFCLTSANSALPIAKQIAPFLRKGQLYVDMNSTAPGTKEQIYKILDGSDGTFVEAAVMASVPANRTRVPVYVCGEAAERLCEITDACGMNFMALSEQIGAASAMKMIKSVLFKGFIALLTETVFAAERYGITEKTLGALKSILTQEMTFEECCNYFLCTMATHSERLGYEMEEVLSTLDSMGENTIMTRATLEKMRWMSGQGYNQKFSTRPENYKEIVAYRDKLEVRER
ncbi:MAG: DUF1932 domain-containing protein [Lachnospiraceae bacterium]|nr:DUF1932 domain-containing protein [Lachnospiraceae bacterium]